MRLCIDNMIIEDIKKIKNSKSVDKFELLTIIEKVALSIELVNKNSLTENEVRKLLSKEEFKLLKHFGGFKKETGKNDIWKFDHNNFQEYLAAKAISKCSFDKILSSISFAPDYHVLNPSWFNTIGYLVSAVEDKQTFNELLEWLISNNKEFVVRIESQRIASDVRIKVFKAIYEEYERNEMFLNSNQFTDQQLVQFANDNYEIFKYLMAKVNDSSSKIVFANGLRLLGCIDYSASRDHFEILYKYCFEVISSKIDDNKIGVAISCLANTQKVIN